MKKLFLILALLISARCFGQAVIVSSSGDCAGGQPPVFNATTKLYDCQTISTAGAPALQNGLVSGGSVTYTGSGLIFTVQAATYNIAGVQYTSAQTNVTLDPADGAQDRIDAVIVDDTGAATKITGSPGSPPTDPSADPTSQLQLTFVYVAASATTPSNITTDNIYLENTEWTCAAGAGWNCASTTNPYAGTKDIEATAVAAGTYTTLTSGAPVALYNYNALVFYIRSKTTWNNNRSLTLQFYSGSTAVGSGVVLRNGTFGFTSATTATYQQISISLQPFNVPSTITRLRITSSGRSGSAPGFYLDNIMLQGGLSAPSLPSGIMVWKIGGWNPTQTYSPYDVVTYGGATFIALVSNTAVTPVVGSTWAAVSAAAGSSAVTAQFINEGATGTTLHRLAKVSEDNAGTVKVTATTDTGRGHSIIGVVSAGAGTTGTATVVISGTAQCDFDGGNTAGNLIATSVTTGGKCHDDGTVIFATDSDRFYVGRSQSTNVGAGTYPIDVFPLPQPAYTNAAYPLFMAYFPSNPTPVSSNLTQEGVTSASPIALTLGTPLRLRSTNNSTATDLKQSALGSSGVDFLVDLAGPMGANYGMMRIGNGTGSAAYYSAAYDLGTTNGNIRGGGGYAVEGWANTYKFALNGAGTFDNFSATGADAGFLAYVYGCQDGTGGRALTWGANFHGATTIPAAASACFAQMFLDTNGASGPIMAAVAPAMPIHPAAITAHSGAISAVTLASPVAAALMRFSGTVNCTATEATSTVTLNVLWTDTSSTAQTLSTTATCAAFGVASVGDLVHTIRVKAGTNVQYSTSIANTPTHDVDVALETL